MCPREVRWHTTTPVIPQPHSKSNNRTMTYIKNTLVSTIMCIALPLALYSSDVTRTVIEFRNTNQVNRLANTNSVTRAEAAEIGNNWFKYREVIRQKSKSSDDILEILNSSLDVAQISLNSGIARATRRPDNLVEQRFPISDKSPAAIAYFEMLSEAEEEYRLGEKLMFQILVDLDGHFGLNFITARDGNYEIVLEFLKRKIRDDQFCLVVVSKMKELSSR